MDEQTLARIAFWIAGFVLVGYLPISLALYWLVKVRGGEESASRLRREREISGLFGERPAQRWSTAGHFWTMLFATVVTAIGYLLAYPAAGSLLTGAEVEPGVLQTISQPLFFAFLGAYLFAVHTTARRFHTGDLNPDAYIDVATRMIVAVIVAAILGLGLAETGSDSPLARNIVYILSFVVGIFPENGLDWVVSLARQRLPRAGEMTAEERQRWSIDSNYPLQLLKGLNRWHAIRLNVEGIDNVHNLANADLPELIRKTRFSVQQLVDWVDQAVLLIHLRNYDEFVRVQELGIRGLSDFQGVYRNSRVRDRLARVLDDEPAAAASDKAAETRRKQRLDLLYTTLQQTPSGDSIRLFWRYKSSYLTGAFESFSRGRVFTELGKYEPAIEQFERALEQNPLHPLLVVSRGEARRLWGQQLQLQGDGEGAQDQFRQALSDFTRAMELDPFYVPAYLERATTYALMGKFEQAGEDLDQALAISRDDPATLAQRGLVHLRHGQQLLEQGQLEKAREAFAHAADACSDAIRLDRNYVGSYVTLAGALRELEDYQKAEERLEEAIRIDPTAPELYYQRARLYVSGERRRFAAAYGDFERALRMNHPDPAAVYTAWGKALLEEGDYVKAIAALRLAIAANPIYLPAYTLRASAFQALGRLQDAVADYSYIVERLDPDAAEAYVDRGVAYAALGETEMALRDFDRGVQLNPNLPKAYINRGQLARTLGQRDQARADFRQAIRVQELLAEATPGSDRPSAIPYNNLGTLMMQEQEWEEARRLLEQATALEPRSAEAWNNLGLVLGHLGKPRLALDNFNAAVNLEPQNPVYLTNRGLQYLQQGMLDRALADFDRAIRLDPQHTAAYVGRAEAHARAGDRAAATTDLERVIAVDPANSQARRLRDELAAAPAPG